MLTALPKTGLAAIATIGTIQTTFAQTTELPTSFSVDTRLRWEQAQSEAESEAASALTLRIRPTLEIKPHSNISLLGEVEAVVGLIPDNRNGFFGDESRPQIPDPEGIELNRLQALIGLSDTVSINLGRQQISLDEERFIGISNFRQNQQTYDAITTNVTTKTGVAIDAGYIWQVNSFLGSRHPAGKIDSQSFFLDGGIPTLIGYGSLFHYNLDLKVGGTNGEDIKSETTGIRLNGRRALGPSKMLFWRASYAEQEINDARPDYFLGSVGLDVGEVTIVGRFEQLGTDDGTAFQTPLGTLHKFQGRSDIFTRTPEDGLNDSEISMVWRIGSFYALRGSRLNVQYNKFESADGGLNYGEETGAEFSTLIGGTRFGIATSRYEANAFATDTDKTWITFSRQF